MKLEAHRKCLENSSLQQIRNRILCHPMQGNADSGIREIFACGILNPGLWNPEYSFRNPPYFRLESGGPVQLTKNLETNT